MLSRNREIKNLYCYLLTWIEGKSNRKLLSGHEKYLDVPYGPPYDISLYCYLLTLIESKSNRKLLSGNEKYRDVPYGPP